jgi:hypothetical protein
MENGSESCKLEGGSEWANGSQECEGGERGW